MDYCRMLLVTKSHHERDEEKAVDKNQAGDIGSVSKASWLMYVPFGFPNGQYEYFLVKISSMELYMERRFCYICVICFANAHVKEHILLYQKNI